ncbi:MAG: arylsulfatase A-like enzyme [Myxococcota bacterium]|jgi:arylsulfatase A-like enzyme
MWRIGWVLLVGCGPGAATLDRPSTPQDTAPAATGPENVLIIVLDDIGLDKVGAYGMHPDPPSTPTLDQLAAEGVRFTHAYAHPTCTPTRAALLTGQYASRAGLGTWSDPWSDLAELDTASITLPRVLHGASEHVWSNAAVGKWHVGSFLRRDPGAHPLEAGFSTHRGSLANPHNAILNRDEPRDYLSWEKNVDGDLSLSETYMTIDTVDEAIALAEELPEPWLLYVAFNAAHTPLHAPPAHLLDAPLPADATEADLFAAMVTALDTELARMLVGIDLRTAAPITTLVIGDNGTPTHAILPPLDPLRSKGTVAEGGVRVPLIVTGPRVGRPGAVSDAPVHVVDVLPTLAEIAGVDPTTLTDERGEPWVLDGTSLLRALADPDWVGERLLYSEQFGPNGPPPWAWFGRTLRDDRYKLVQSALGDALFRLGDGLDEGPELISGGLNAEEGAALDGLRQAMEAMEAMDRRW